MSQRFYSVSDSVNHDKRARSAELAVEMAAWEKKHGKIVTTPCTSDLREQSQAFTINVDGKPRRNPKMSKQKWKENNGD